MSNLRTAQPFVLPPPVLGMNKKDALSNMDPLYSPWLVNVDCEGGFLKVRNGIKIHCTLGNNQILALGTYAAAPASAYRLYAWLQTSGVSFEIYDITNGGAPSLVYTGPTNAPDEVWTTQFSGSLYWWTEVNSGGENTVYNGTVWGSTGYTGSGNNGMFSVGFKGRQYTGYRGDNTYYYGGDGLTSGAMTAVNLTSLFETTGGLAWIATFSQTEGSINDQYIAFGSTAGEVLIYAGDYPGAPTWSIRSKFVIGKPLGAQNWISYQGDALIITDTGLVSLRDLFLQGSQAALNLTVSAMIDKYWQQLVKSQSVTWWNAPTKQWSGVFWPEKKKIMILAKGFVDEDGAYNSSQATMFVFDTINGAWSLYRFTTIDAAKTCHLTYFNGNVYFVTDNVVMTFDLTSWKDEQYDNAGNYSSYVWDVWGANSTYSSASNIKKVNAYETIINTDFDDADVKLKTVGDFGTTETSLVTTTLQTGYNRAMFQAGVDGVYIQYRLGGNTTAASTQGLELYGVNTVFEQGGIR